MHPNDRQLTAQADECIIHVLCRFACFEQTILEYYVKMMVVFLIYDNKSHFLFLSVILAKIEMSGV